MSSALASRAVLAAAVLAIGAKLLHLPGLHYVAKPAATLACVAVALAFPARSARYQRGVVAGLLLGTVGDVLLMLPDEGLFRLGLGAFLVGHVAYLWAMTDGVRLLARWQPALVVGVLLALLLGTLLRAVEPALRIPVAVYMVTLGTMAAQARVRALVAPDAGHRWGAIGATLFMVSDALLGVDRFVMAVPFGTVWILATYWGAQWGIARSVGGGMPAAIATPAS